MPLFVLPTLISLVVAGYICRDGGVPLPGTGVSADVWGWLVHVTQDEEPWTVCRDNLLLFLVPFSIAQFLLYVKPQRNFFRPFKFNPKMPSVKLMLTELMRSLRGVLIASALEIGAARLYSRGLAPLPVMKSLQATYESHLAVPVSSAVVGGLLLYAWGDLHFYSTHRLLHLNTWLYKNVHSVHHESYNPDPFSGLSMHPIESTVYFSAGILTAVLAPWYLCRIMCKGLIIFPLEGHSGYGVQTSPSSRFHYEHHARFNVNYGSSALWDTVFGTLYKPRNPTAATSKADRASRKQAEEMAAIVGHKLESDKTK